MASRSRGWVATFAAGLAGVPMTATFGVTVGMILAIAMGCAVGLLTVPLRHASPDSQFSKRAKW